MGIRIAICDDEQCFINELVRRIGPVEQKLGEGTQVEAYTDSIELHKSLIAGEYYDLIFLDIVMPEYDGIAIGKLIRGQLNNNTTQIVYISSESKYAMELFKIRPMDFLIKPITQERVDELLDMAIKLINTNSQVFTCSGNGENYVIPIKDIYYMESSARKIIIHTVSRDYEIYDKLDDIYHRVKKFNFIYIHKSFLVNYLYVRSIRANSLTLDNGKALPISRNRKDEIHKLCNTLFIL